VGYAGLQPEDPRAIGPYRLLGQLGTGGMGQVFLGMSAGGRPIAVKVIRTELATDPDFRARFRREVAAAQKVSGLFTALVVDADLDCPMPWLATAYVAGPSLTEAVRGHGPLPVRSVLALTAGLAEGLDAIHTAGVVHRDLKPSNVLLAEDGPRVIDFGISEAAEASVVAGANVLIGSPGYMSPEQVLGADIGPASDIFSLGSVLTFAATGTGPFGAGSNAALMYRLVNSRADLDDVPGELRSLVGGCLAKHPDDRPTARQLLAEVGALQPAPGWLAESIMNSFIQDPPVAAAVDLAGASKQVTGTGTSAPPSGAAPPPRSGSAASPRHRRSRAAPDLPAVGLGVSHRRAGGGFGRGGLRPDRRQPHPGSQPSAAAGRRRSGGDHARFRVVQPGAQLTHGFLTGSPGIGPRFAERVLHPGPVRIQHVDAAGAGQPLAGQPGGLRIPVGQAVALVGPPSSARRRRPRRRRPRRPRLRRRRPRRPRLRHLRRLRRPRLRRRRLRRRPRRPQIRRRPRRVIGPAVHCSVGRGPGTTSPAAPST
jgi:hypothetical protein